MVTSGLPSRSRWSRSPRSRTLDARGRRRRGRGPCRPARRGSRGDGRQRGSGGRRLSSSIRREASKRVSAAARTTRRARARAGAGSAAGGVSAVGRPVAGLWVVIGHGRAWARRAGPSSPGPSGLAKRRAGQGLTALRARRAWLADRTERHPHQVADERPAGRCKGAVTLQIMARAPTAAQAMSSRERAAAARCPCEGGHDGVLGRRAQAQRACLQREPCPSPSGAPARCATSGLAGHPSAHRSSAPGSSNGSRSSSRHRTSVWRGERKLQSQNLKSGRRGNRPAARSTPRCRQAHRGDPAAASSQGDEPRPPASATNRAARSRGRARGAVLVDRHPGRDVRLDVDEARRRRLRAHRLASSPNRRRSSSRRRRKSSPRGS